MITTKIHPFQDSALNQAETYIYQTNEIGEVVNCNQIFRSFFDPQQEIELTDHQKTLMSAIHENNVQVLSSGKATVLKESYLDPLGHLIACYTYKMPLKDKGKTTGLLSVSAPLSLCNEIVTKKEKPTSGAELEHIVANLPGHVYWKDKEGVYLGCNDSQAKSLGLRYGTEVIGKTDFDLPWPEGSAAIFRENDLKVMQSESLVLAEEEATVNGKHATVLSQKIPLRNKTGKVVGIVGISLDITQRKVAEKAKSEFIANMSHDLRTPTIGIMAMLRDLQNLAEETEPMLDTNQTASVETLRDSLRQIIERTQEHTVLAQDAAEGLLHLFNQILNAFKLESGQISSMEPAVFNLHELLTRNKSLLQTVATDTQLDLNLIIDPSVPIWVKGLETYLIRSVLNLMSNALKFTETGFVKMVVTTNQLKCAVGDTVIVTFECIDSGIGIPSDKIATIFDPFSKVVASYKGRYKGSGLGLYLVKNYVEAMKGHIEVKSVLGKGTTFTLKLPLKVADLPQT